MKYTLTLKQSGSFAQNPRFAEIEGENIICNDINLPQHIEKSFNPHNVRLWVIGNEFGALCAIFAPHAQYALDNAVDADKLDCMMCEDQTQANEDGELTHLGNAGELFDLSYAWMGEVEFEPARDIALIVALAHARGACSDALE